MDKREENLLKLKNKVNEKSKKFWSEYMDEESMPNDLLDMAIDLIHYQEGLLKNIEAKLVVKEKQLDESVELLKDFAFVCIDDTTTERSKAALKVQEFLKNTSANEWLEKQLEITEEE